MCKFRWLDSTGPWRASGGAARAAVTALVAVAVLSLASAAFARPPDAVKAPDRKGMETRLAACAFCHGKQGQGDLDRRGGVYPRLAGQPSDYLYQQMTAFVSGKRTGIPPVVLMRGLLKDLSPAYLRRIADFYHNSDPAYPPLQAVDAAELRQGRKLVEHGLPAQHVPACTTCHGSDLTGRAPAIPALAGQNDRYLTVQFMHWTLDQRHNPLHRHIAEALTEQQVEAVSAYLSSLRPEPKDAAK